MPATRAVIDRGERKRLATHCHFERARIPEHPQNAYPLPNLPHSKSPFCRVIHEFCSYRALLVSILTFANGTAWYFCCLELLMSHAFDSERCFELPVVRNLIIKSPQKKDEKNYQMLEKLRTNSGRHSLRPKMSRCSERPGETHAGWPHETAAQRLESSFERKESEFCDDFN